MELHCEQHKLQQPLHRPRTWRGDFSSAGAIERCLALQASYGTLFAAILLREQGADVGLAVRVLARHVHRRPQPRSIVGLRTYISPPPLIYRHTHY